MRSESGFAARLFVFLQGLVPQGILTRIAGAIARARLGPVTTLLVKGFSSHYRVDLGEAACPDPGAYDSFNDFFTRRLRDGARPIADGPLTLVSPCDGAVSEAGPLDGSRLLQAKGMHYRVETLLCDDALAERFRGGSFATLYLAPSDYHRVHMPLDGTLERMVYVPGRLFSVNPTTAALRDGLFARNERVVCSFRGPQGPFVMVLVGAMIVGGIRTVWAGRVTPRTAESWRMNADAPVTLRRGDEMGLFELGSTVILLHPGGRIVWNPDLAPGRRLRMGEGIGRILEARGPAPFDPDAPLSNAAS
ncbi:MAG: archaetidylserine decarboxylase [Pseudomonadales bacterium]|jgi:phosphatidylserine decarboxylase|nr:archaetidylserine decarboxylase [Pseudomonadales bacterium]